MNLLEWLAAGLGLGGVLLGIAQKTAVWPLWIASSAIYVFIYARLALWGQVGLMVLFIGLSLWGLLQWRRQTAQAQARPGWLGLPHWRTLLLLVFATWLLLGVFLGQTDNPHAWLDAWVTSISLFAMGLMARRRLDCWLFWGVANASAVVLFAQQGLWPTVALYSVQLVLSWLGLRRWRAVSPEVRRVAVIGAESTGKTSLCQFLAQHLGGISLAEPLRQWVAHHGRSPTADEQWQILQSQKRAEDEALRAARSASKHWVLCDSAPILTAVYSQFYFQDDALLAQAVAHHKEAYSHTLVCDTDLGWQAEPGMRDGPQAQAEVQRLLLKALQSHGVAYCTVRGSGEYRNQLAAQLLTGVDSTHR